MQRSFRISGRSRAIGEKRSDIRRLFREHGLSPKKWMGQNLLVDSSYLERIVAAAEIKPYEPIVEIGAGFGVLTEALIREHARVWALELDAGFFRVLQEKFRDQPDVTLIHADALKYDFRALAEKLGRLRVVANLPYNISSRLIFRSYENRDIFGSLCILLQKEVAERLIAKPHTKDYGILTVLLGAGAVVELLFHIPAKAFFPEPEITSTLVMITFPEPPPVSVKDWKVFTRLVKASFSGRRKTLRNALRNNRALGAAWEDVLAAADSAQVDLGRRAETLSAEEFAHFADELCART
ncbi:MAG: 16S rRNA (adenine(1518)-N(6)/adenine(1519)-N(6))-dimethyltransferase RsmA [Thermodesulfobacteriota bacterium]